MKKFTVNSVLGLKDNLNNFLPDIGKRCILEFSYVAEFKYPDGVVPVKGNGEVTDWNDLYELLREEISDDDVDDIFNALVIDDFTVDYIAADEYENLSENVLIDDDALYFYYAFNIKIV